MRSERTAGAYAEVMAWETWAEEADAISTLEPHENESVRRLCDFLYGSTTPT
jgi:hypothetical protein